MNKYSKSINREFDFDDDEFYDDSHSSQYNYEEEEIDSLDIEEIYDEIREQVIEDIQDQLHSYMSEYTQKIKQYIQKTIDENNSRIEEYINEILSSLEDEYEEEEEEEDEIDETVKNKFSKMVTHKKDNTEVRNKLQESMNTMFGSDSEWETFPATSRDAMGFGHAVKGNSNVVSAPQNVNLRNYLPPDEGRVNDPELGTHHRDSILDVAGAIPDDSVMKALTTDYSKMFKK